MPRRKITKRALTRKGKQPPTTPRPPPQAAERDSAPPRAVLPTSPEIQQHFVRRLALLADDAAALSDTVEGQSRERGENDAVMIRNIARVLGALTFGAVTKDDKARAIVHDLGAMARTALERDGIAGVRLQEDGTPIGPPIDPEEGDEPSFARGGDVETARTTMLRHLHRSFVDWLEKGKTDEELAKKTCARVNGMPVRRLMGPPESDFRRVMGPPLSQHEGATGKGGVTRFRSAMGPPQTPFSQGHGATRSERPEVIQIHSDGRRRSPSGGIDGVQGAHDDRRQGSAPPLVGGAE